LYRIELAEVVEATSPKPTTTPDNDPPPPSNVVPQVIPTSEANDTEEEKRKRRAERFGIPVVEPKPKEAKGKGARTAAQALAPAVSFYAAC
jgi:hypothetical protein